MFFKNRKCSVYEPHPITAPQSLLKETTGTELTLSYFPDREEVKLAPKLRKPTSRRKRLGKATKKSNEKATCHNCGKCYHRPRMEKHRHRCWRKTIKIEKKLEEHVIVVSSDSEPEEGLSLRKHLDLNVWGRAKYGQ